MIELQRGANRTRPPTDRPPSQQDRVRIFTDGSEACGRDHQGRLVFAVAVAVAQGPATPGADGSRRDSPYPGVIEKVNDVPRWTNSATARIRSHQAVRPEANSPARFSTAPPGSICGSIISATRRASPCPGAVAARGNLGGGRQRVEIASGLSRNPVGRPREKGRERDISQRMAPGRAPPTPAFRGAELRRHARSGFLPGSESPQRRRAKPGASFGNSSSIR